jgi:hypothetical protein
VRRLEEKNIMVKKPSATSGATKAAEKISLAKLAPEIARKNMKALLLANANYFGNLKGSGLKSVLDIAGDTTYENIECVGFNPQVARLEAVVFINQNSGYDGDVCTNGSQEFVRFYLSYDGGTTWTDQGLTNFTVYDVPGTKPLEFDATLQISPAETFCFFESLPTVRAILSWNTPPPANTPAWTPIWGNVLDVQIQIAATDFIIFNQLLTDAKVTLPEEYKKAVDLTQSIKAAAPKGLGAADLYALYRNTSVPGHRYLLTELTNAMQSPNLAANSATVATTVGKAPAGKATAATLAPKGTFAGIGNLDLESLIEGLLNTNGDTFYEELDCVGLNPNLDQLVGVINIKQNSGYNGGLCTTGSQEYVAFWIDWGSGWEYQGTTSVNVHDISGIPAGGLQYSVFLPVNVTAHQQPCGDGPVTAKVRGVLSWNVPPSTTDANAGVVWGDSDDTLVLIDPGVTVQPGDQIPFLTRVGDIDESLVNSSGLITDAYTLETGAHYVNSPFGGNINIAGLISNPVPGMTYRIMKKPHGAPASAYEPVIAASGLTLTVDSISGGILTQTVETLTAGPGGYYQYQVYDDQTVEENIMGVFNTGPADTGNAYDIQIFLNTDGNPVHDVPSNMVTVLVNNTMPVAELVIDLGGGVECADFNVGDPPFSADYTATATDFGSFNFVIEPSGPANGVLPSPASGQSTYYGGGIADPGTSGTATINTGVNPGPPVTGPMEACGYSLTLQVWDRTNVDNGQTSNYNQASVGFCLNTD